MELKTASHGKRQESHFQDMMWRWFRKRQKRNRNGYIFGIGNIFRIFIGGIADGLLEEGVLDRGITCVETFDYDVVDKIYKPYDNLGLSVILHGDGTREYKVLGSLAEAVKSTVFNPEQWKRLKEIFTSPSLQMVSFTITEKKDMLCRNQMEHGFLCRI